MRIAWLLVIGALNFAAGTAFAAPLLVRNDVDQVIGVDRLSIGSLDFDIRFFPGEMYPAVFGETVPAFFGDRDAAYIAMATLSNALNASIRSGQFVDVGLDPSNLGLEQRLLIPYGIRDVGAFNEVDSWELERTTNLSEWFGSDAIALPEDYSNSFQPYGYVSFTAAVPEPTTATVFLIGLVFLAISLRRRASCFAG